MVECKYKKNTQLVIKKAEKKSCGVIHYKNMYRNIWESQNINGNFSFSFDLVGGSTDGIVTNHNN